jgi:hypothetical protein
MFRARKRLPTRWEGTAELLFGSVIGTLGAGGRIRGDGLRAGAS